MLTKNADSERQLFYYLHFLEADFLLISCGFVYLVKLDQLTNDAQELIAYVKSLQEGY